VNSRLPSLRNARVRKLAVGCAAAVCCALLGGLGATPVRGQSWLSETPATGAGPDRTASGVPQLIEQVGKADSKALYGALRPLVMAEMSAPKEGRTPASWQRRGLAALLQLGDSAATPADQEVAARLFVERFPDDDQFPTAFVRLNLALFRQAKPLETSFFFDQAAQNALPAAWLSRYLLVLAGAAERAGDFAAAAEFRLQELDSPRSAHLGQSQEILDDLERIADRQALSRLLESWNRVTWVREQAPFLSVGALMRAGQLGEALLALEQVSAQGATLTSNQRTVLSSLRQELRRRSTLRPDRVGVLLPLGSSSAALRELARDTLDGLRMALGNAAEVEPSVALEVALDRASAPERETRKSTSGERAPRFELLVRDTANNPQTAAQAVESLAGEEGVIAIIGPLARAESEAAASRAEELGVPLISLSLSQDLPVGAQYVFRNSKSPEDEVRDLVWYAMDYLQARRFAILYPSNAYGERMQQLFWEEAQRRGGSLAGAATFTPWNVKTQQADKDAVGLKHIFESFVGQDRPLRPRDRALLESVGDARPDALVDFDALFIPLGPDAAQDLRLIAPYPVSVDAENVLLLGTRFWNEDAVLVAGGNKLEGSVFADVYDRSGAQPRVAAFLSRHRAWYGHRPRYAAPSYYTAAGFDTLTLLDGLLRESRNRSREALARALKVSPPVPGVTGLTAFRPSGEATKETLFFRIRGGEFVRQAQ
jgi:ABC-type branched-subunit amino acid transport system substrate-binding protein